VPVKRLGEGEKLRLGHDRESGKGKSGMGTRRGVFNALPEIGYYGSEPILFGSISMVERKWRRQSVGHRCQGCRCVNDAGASVANGETAWRIVKTTYPVF